jgi:hypothetical protein
VERKDGDGIVNFAESDLDVEEETQGGGVRSEEAEVVTHGACNDNDVQ